VYRKLMMLLMAVAVLGLAIGLVGCPKKVAPPTGEVPPPMPGGPGRALPPGVESMPKPPVEEAPAEEAPAEEAPAEEAPGE